MHLGTLSISRELAEQLFKAVGCLLPLEL